MFAVVFTIFALCFGSSFAAVDECVKGEQFWCSSMENAVKCGALKHCVATVWKNDVTNERAMLFDNCKMCTDFLEKAKMFLEDKTTRQTVKFLIKEELCPLFKDFEATCRVAVDHYADEFLELIASEIDPKAICHFLHICPEFKFKDKFEIEGDATKKSNNVVTCELCKFFIDRLKDFIGSEPTKEKIEEALEKLCNLVPKSMQDTCHHFIRNYADMLFELILNNMESEKICAQLNLCDGLRLPEKQVNHLVDKCEVCEIVFSYLEGMLEKNSTVQMIENAVLKVCSVLPSSYYKEICDNMVEEFTPLIVKAIVNNMKPRDACTFLNLCSPKKQYYKCISGPKYWCASEANAKLCQAEEHCKKFVWV